MLNNLRALPIPSILSDYKIESVLGQGGFGITYLATEVTFERKVAIKEYYPRDCAVRDGTRTVRPTGNQEDIDNFNTKKFKLYLFNDEDSFKKKIRLHML